jgi:uncharacterized protein YozE (UPF0346 family)
MNIDKKILDRIDQILESGNQVIATRTSPGHNVIGDDRIDISLASQWFASALNIIERIFGKESNYFESISRYNSEYPVFSDFSMALGVFKAVREDYEAGSIFDLRKLIEAELFDDFLEQSHALLEVGYYQPAAVIAGSVLEDGLRKLCIREDIDLPKKPKLDGMNSDLAKKGIYPKLTQKKITALADIRNSAAHGNWNDFTKDDVTDLIRWTRNFMEQNYV